MSGNRAGLSMADDGEVSPGCFTRGDATGIEFPVDAQALVAGGADFLTRAFRSFGTLPSDAAVRIDDIAPCSGGSTGQKLLLTVSADPPGTDLHTGLFAKFSRDFHDPVRDNRGKYEMAAEARLAALSRHPNFPVEVPKVYFADYQQRSHTGILITQRIAFGADGIEPQHPKCMDHQLADPLAYYRELVATLAKLAAAHRSGALGDAVETHFPYDPAATVAAYVGADDAARLAGLARAYRDFARKCPRLLPAAVTAESFLARLDDEIPEFLAHAGLIRALQLGDRNDVALCHWNAHIDNGWFWRDEGGALRCGLMDWGEVGQMNVAFALWGCLSGAQPWVWRDHLDELLALFTSTLHANGGPLLDLPRLRLQLQMHAAMLGLSYFFACPALILERVPEACLACEPEDARITGVETVRSKLNMLSIFLSVWESGDMPALLAQLRTRQAEPDRLNLSDK